ncbi:MAG: carboxypeptidase, partial [Flavobacteriales bacterium]
MSPRTFLQSTLCYFFGFTLFSISGQNILPPVKAWSGTSESLIVRANDPWITPTEMSDFVTTPDYGETMEWLKELSSKSPLLHMVSIGRSVEGREIFMIIASTDQDTAPEALKESEKPLLLAQAGIHSGEIDGKDAGMMLLRDIAFGDKKELLDQVNFLFIPILSVDAHERSSTFNRPNQRGPQNMGWRTNAQNLNLNRDYAKLDTNEIRAVVQVMNDYDPLLYMDIHVTDGVDYQYDVTFGGLGQQGYSPSISNWLETAYKPYADRDLKANGHLPGPLLFALNDRDFSQGNILNMGGPRFSDGYGNLRHLPTILVENHSLKPFKQRVLGTYVLLESTLRLLATEGQKLREITIEDQTARSSKIPMRFKVPQMKNAIGYDTQSDFQISDHIVIPPDTLLLLGISSKILKSSVTNSDFIEWTGKPETMKVVNYLASEPIDLIVRPKGYWVPASCEEVMERLKLHGIQMEIITEPREVIVEMYRIRDAKF